MRYRFVAFDVDGTLVDSEAVNTLSLQALAHEMLGHELPPSEVKSLLGITGHDAIVRMGISDVAAALDRLEEIDHDLASGITVFAGIEDVLSELLHMGIKMGVVTSRSGAEYARDIEPLGLDLWFESIIVSDCTERHKPDAQPLLEYLVRAGAKPYEVLYVGDTEDDMKCAHKAGIDFALVGWGDGSRPPAAANVVSEPTELLSLVKSMEGMRALRT